MPADYWNMQKMLKVLKVGFQLVVPVETYYLLRMNMYRVTSLILLMPVQYTLYTIHYTLYTIHYTLYTQSHSSEQSLLIVCYIAHAFREIIGNTKHMHLSEHFSIEIQ